MTAKQTSTIQQATARFSNIDGDLLSKVSNLGPSELLLLAGYCAGLAENNSTDVTTHVAVNPVTESGVKVLVLYASQTGNAESIAKTLGSDLDSKGYFAHVESTLDVKLSSIKNYSLILIIASTHGEGEPPDDAIDFHEAVYSKKAPALIGTKHAVLGLGDSSYEFFCQTAKEFDEVLIKLGSVPLVDRVDCDIDFELDAQSWSLKVLDALETWQPAVVAAAPNTVNVLQFPHTKDKPFSATLSGIQKITAPGSIKDTYHLELDLSGSGISYQPGDSIGVWAENDQSLVEEILSELEILGTTEAEFKGDKHSIEYLLLHKLEITLLNKGLIKALALLSNSQRLNEIADAEYPSYINNHQLLDVLKLAKSSLNAQQLVDLLKPLKPRLYSISSSLEENPDEVHVTLNHVQSENEDGVRYGQASHFLTRNSNVGDKINLYVDQNDNFRLPSPDKPIIMVGPGTGVAPFRAFLQQRELQDAKGPSWLFFGNPNFNSDFLYQTELQKYVKSGVLSQIDLAFSRDQKSKVYVQDKLLSKGKEVWQWLEQGAYFYVCGDMSRMAKEVESTLLGIIKVHGQRSHEQAKGYLKQLKKQSRYQRDVY